MWESAAAAFVKAAAGKAGGLVAGVALDKVKDWLRPDAYEAAAGATYAACEQACQIHGKEGRVVLEALADTLGTVAHAEALAEALIAADPVATAQWFRARDPRIVPFLHQFLMLVGHSIGTGLGGNDRRLWTAVETSLAQSYLATWEERAHEQDKARPRLNLGGAKRAEVAGDPDFQALTAFTEASPFTGRKNELADLREWMADGAKRVSARVITGRGGAGKTRLALHLAREASRAGWHAGFLGDPSELTSEAIKRWQLETHTLVIIDYAAGRASQIAAWFRAIAADDGWFDQNAVDHQMRLRILLVERQAGSWVDTVFGEGRALRGGEPVDVGGFATEERRSLFLWALTDADATKGALLDAFNGIDQALDGTTWKDEPLYLIMAGLNAAAEGGSIHAALRLSRGDLAYWRATGTEAQRVDEIAKQHGVAPELLRHLVAYITLCRGVRNQHIFGVIAAERVALHRSAGADDATVREALGTVLGASTSSRGAESLFFPALEPDVVGEMFILCFLQDYSPTHPDGSVARADRAVDHDADIVSTLVRVHEDYAQQGEINGIERAVVGWAALWVRRLVRQHRNDRGWAASLMASLESSPEFLPREPAERKEILGRFKASRGAGSGELAERYNSPEGQAIFIVMLESLTPTSREPHGGGLEAPVRERESS